MAKGISNLLLTCLILATEFDALGATMECWDFKSKDSADQWTNNGRRPWVWSGIAGGPPNTYFPTFSPPPNGAGYMFLYDLSTPPNTGTMKTVSSNITLEANGEVSIKIWRHILYDDGSFRPVLNFVSDEGQHKQSILWSYDYDKWDEVSLSCGPGSEPCCLKYPCTGYLTVDGSILMSGELLAITDISLGHATCTI